MLVNCCVLMYSFKTGYNPGADARAVPGAGDVPGAAAAHRSVLHSARLLQVQTGAG